MTAIYKYRYLLGFFYLADAITGFQNWNETHVWCDGNVKEQNPISSLRCCASAIFDTTKESCCERNPSENRPPVNSIIYHCCQMKGAEHAFDNEYFLCCNGDILKKEHQNVLYGCCGRELFDYDNFICCNEEIAAKSVGPGPSDQICCGNKKLYDSQRQICQMEYDSRINDWKIQLIDVENNHTALCSGEKFDTEVQACCSGKLAAKDQSLKHVKYPACCQTESKVTPYDYTTQVCCPTSGDILEIPLTIRDQVDRPECCNGQLITDHSYQLCCGDKIQKLPADMLGTTALSVGNHCCGSQLILNFTTHFCCGGVVREKTGMTRDDGYDDYERWGCCHDKVIDKRSEYCCDGVQKIAGNIKDVGCCYSDGKEVLYYLEFQFCDANGVGKRIGK